MTTGKYHKESSMKVREWVSPQDWIIRKVVLKLQNAYNHRSGSKGNFC